MIIHASLKTDIAQFYSDWIIKRLKEGFIDISAMISITIVICVVGITLAIVLYNLL